jgi:hypothetical protein
VLLAQHVARGDEAAEEAPPLALFRVMVSLSDSGALQPQ